MTNPPVIASLRRRVFYVIVVCLGVAGIAVGFVVAGGGVTASELQGKLIAACQNSRTPLQAYFAGQLAESRSHSLGYYAQRFPDFPPDELRQAIRKQRRNLSTLVETFDPSSCASQYR